MTKTPQRRERQGFSFDAQAWIFDRRASLPAAARSRIARAIGELAGLDAGDRLVEVGAGTGEIGIDLAARQKLRYVGFDLSLSMLAVFRRKLQGERGGLVLADADRPWPIARGQARVVFLSRSAHLLRAEHLAAEVLRVSDPRDACLILGGVHRDKGCVHACMRRQMHRLLAAHGVEGRSRERTRRRLITALGQRAWQPLPPRVAATWRVAQRPADSLTSWGSVTGLAGKAVAAAVKDDVLRRLALWALDRYGDLEAAIEATERYELAAIRPAVP